MDKLTFHKTKKEQTKGIVLSILILLMSAYLIYYGLKTGSIALPIIFGLFILLTIRLLLREIRNAPSVIIDETGIRNNTNGMRLVPWGIIYDFEIKKALNGKVLAIMVNDQQEYLKTVNRFARSIMKTNISKLGSPAVISEKEFHEPLDSALEKIAKYREGLKQQ